MRPELSVRYVPSGPVWVVTVTDPDVDPPPLDALPPPEVDGVELLLEQPAASRAAAAKGTEIRAASGIELMCIDRYRIVFVSD